MIDQLTKHQIYIQRLANGIVKDIIPILQQIRDDINARILADPNIDLIKTRKLLKDINNIIDNNINAISFNLLEQLVDFAEYEQSYILGVLDKSTPTTIAIGTGLETAQLALLISDSKIKFAGQKGMTINQMIGVFSQAYKDDIKSAIELGIANGDTTDTIARNIKTMANNRTLNQARAVVLTSTNHAGAMARRNAWQPYHNLFEGEEYVATLDSRTTIICASLDGKIFPFNEGPQPPLHYRCRSIRVPKLKSEYDLDTDNQRASMDGPVSAKTTYQSWLKKQSKAVQEEVLGVERAKLFREGKVKLDGFVDSKGVTYTLEELKTKDKI